MLRNGSRLIDGENNVWEHPEIVETVFEVPEEESSTESYSYSEEDSESTYYEPLSVSIGEVNRNGVVSMKFNQPILIPDEYSSRLLCEDSTEDLNPASNIFEVSFNVNSNEGCLGYTTVISEWASTEVKIQILFDDPFMVSRGNDNDEMNIKLLKSELFVSEASGIPISAAAAIAGASTAIPRQLPLDVTEEDLQRQADQAAATSRYFLFAQLGL